MKSNLSRLMKDRGINIYELVEKTGLSKQTLTRARDERIRHCSLVTLNLIASALGVKTADLYGEDNGQGP